MPAQQEWAAPELMARAPADIRSLAWSHTSLAIKVLAGIAKDGTNEMARVAAAVAVLAVLAVLAFCGWPALLAVAVGANCFFTRPLSAIWDEEDAGSRLADEIRLSIDYYMTQPQAKPVGEVVLSGPGSADGELVESLGTHLGMPVSVPEPLGVFDTSVLSPNEDPHRYTVAAGLSLGAAA